MYGKKWKRTKWMIPLLAASLIMPFSSMGKAAMANEQPVTAEESGQFHRPVTNTARATSPGGLEVTNPSGLTYQKVYDSMYALKGTYPEGTPWTNFTPYGRDGEKADYQWKGGKIKGADRGVGCAAFAFILSDAAFDSLPARDIDHGNFTFEDVKVGDILRVNNNSHFVIVLQKSAGGVTVAEGNFNKTVHWGRAMSVADVEAADFIITRYPDNFVSADDPEANNVFQEGTEGSLQWSLTNAGTLKISGSGEIPNYSPNESRYPSWNEFKDKIKTIVIDSGVTSIGDYAFYQSVALSVFIPNSVTNIGQSAFYGSQLINVTIPGSVGTIGNDAFFNSQNLTSVTVSEGIKTIGERAFYKCTALAYIDFPASITSIGSAAFTGCTSMKSVRFMPGSGTVIIGDDLFAQCGELINVTLPQTADRIGKGMFSSCWRLPSLYIPKSVKTIGLDAFNSCNALTTISFGGSETEWKAMLNPTLSGQLQSINTTVLYDVQFVDPFAKDPNDPGDFIANHTHEWSTDWAGDENFHWHECSTPNCPVTDNSQKYSYAEHTYGSWVTDTDATSYQSGTKHRDCSVCGYQQSGTIPATGGSSSGSGSGSSGGSSWSPGGGSWSSGGNYWNPGSSSSGSSNNSSSSSTTDTDKTDTDKTDSSSNETDNNAGAVDNSGSQNSSAGSDNNAGSTNDVEVSENNTDNASSSVEIAKAKKQLKTEMKTQMKATMKTQIKKELKPQLKAQIKKLLKKQAQIKPKAKAKLKTKLKKDLKQELKAALKAKLKAQLKKEFGKQLGDQFIEEFNTQFNKQFNALYNEQFNKQFQTQFKQLTS